MRREETRVVTADIYQKIEFNRVEPGEFMMGEGTNKVKVILSKPFEMMSTPVTQRQWAMIMGENPSKFINGPDSVVMNINGKQIRIRPDNPVEQVSWRDSKRFIAPAAAAGLVTATAMLASASFLRMISHNP